MIINNESISNKILYFPIKILLIFLIITQVLFFIGPQEKWIINNPFMLIFYLIILNFSLYYGYIQGLHKPRGTIKRGTIKMVNIIIVISLFIGLMHTYWSLGTLSPDVIISKILYGLLYSGEAYYEQNTESVHILRYLFLTICSPIFFMACVFGTYFWKQLKKKYKIIYILIIFLELTRWLAIGVRKGLFDIIIIIAIAYIAGHYKIIDNKKQIRKFLTYISVFLLLFLFYFSISNLSRYSQYSSFTDMLTDYQVKQFYYDNFPQWLIMPIYSITGYLCQGYYALAKALEIGIIEPNIIATNFFTVNIAERFQDNPLQGTYMDLLERYYGISPTVNWHTIYVWLANGLTFLGVPIFMYIIGRIFANSWLMTIKGKDYLSIPLFVILFQLILYSFANNQIFSFSFLVIFTLLFFYFFQKRIKI